MVNFLFECLCEELPHLAQRYILEMIDHHFLEYMKKNNVSGNVNSYVSPSRFVIYVRNIEALNEHSIQIKGPRVSVSEDVVDKFLKKNSDKYNIVFTRDDLNKLSEGKAEYYVLNVVIDNIDMSLSMKRVVEYFLKTLQFRKSMKCNGKQDYTWVRPIKNLLCFLDDKFITIDFHDVQSKNITFGHRFIGSSDDSHSGVELNVSDICNYFCLVEDGNIILSHQERKNKILSDIDSILSDCDLYIRDADLYLVDEIVSLVEYPCVFSGKIEKEFLDIPSEILAHVMIVEQKMLPTFSKNSNMISNKFIAVSNIPLSSNIIRGYERVLQARFSDVKFYIANDLSKGLDYFIEKLKNITFHDSLGDLYSKIERVNSLAKYASVWVPSTSIQDIECLSLLAKFDIVTALGQNYPALCGNIGAYYAGKWGQSAHITDSIIEHNYPVNANSQCAKNPLSMVFAISDSIDTIVGMFSIGKKPTSSKDPFSLRRSAIGIIRNLLENRISIPINMLVHKAVNLYSAKILKEHGLIDRIKKLSSKNHIPANIITKRELEESVLHFLHERSHFYILANGGDAKILSAFKHYINNPYILYKALRIMSSFLDKNGDAIISTYKRVAPIVLNEHITKSRKIKSKFQKFQKKFVVERLELEMWDNASSLKSFIKSNMKNGKILECLDELQKYVHDINNFLDNIVVKSEVKEVQANRMLIMNSLYSSFNKIMKFDVFIEN